MNTAINELLKYNRQAKLLVENADEYASRTDEETEREKKSMLGEYTHRAREHIQAVRDSELQLNRQLEDELAVREKMLREDMETRFEQYHKSWQDELFRRCTGDAET